ncbi:MAG: NeuD/PglB/VioB family sugar acetyltransferase [Actinobacteria bacterium]|nr:NeuD/PglB/VioB family sugar acetyltransferase [Actinomycetota bacterium]
MSQRLVIIGCGGFGREVFSLVEAFGAVGGTWEVEGFADDAPSDLDLVRVGDLGSKVIGTVSDLAERTSPFTAVVAVGSPQARIAITERLAGAPVTWAVLVHPHATIGARVGIGAGSIVAAGARLSTNIVVGRHVHVDQNVTVGHDCVLGNFSRLNPQACISGSVVVGEQVLVGANATVLPGLRAGASSIIGAGAVVVRDVPGSTVVKGVPAR